MAYSEGRSSFLRDKGGERATERARYEYQLAKAEKAAKKDSDKSSLWQVVGSAAGAVGGFFAGGPKGAYRGNLAGKEAGRWGSRLTSGYDPENYAVSTDVGKFDVSQKYELEDINKQFQEADESRFWQDVTGTGVSLMSYLQPPEGLEGKDWWTDTEGGGAPDWLRKFHPQNPVLKSGKRYARV